MATNRNKFASAGDQAYVDGHAPNGAMCEKDKALLRERRGGGKQNNGAMPLATPLVFDWRLLLSGNHLGLISVVISIATVLYSAGWIPGIAKQTDVSGLATQIVEIKAGMEKLGKEFSETRVEMFKAATGIARIEGKLENQPKARPVSKPAPAKPIEPVKAKAFFE